MPVELLAELRRNRAAFDHFAALPPSHQREYIKYVTEAKRPETRQRRAAKAVVQMLQKRS